MTQEQRFLLIKDLTARLPYGVYCKINGIKESKKLIRIEVDDTDGILLDFGDDENSMPIQVYLSEVKPYLRPMLSMINEEMKTYNRLYYYKPIGLIDFVNSNHIDYRRLISQGLAIEAPKDLYNI